MLCLIPLKFHFVFEKSFELVFVLRLFISSFILSFILIIVFLHINVLILFNLFYFLFLPLIANKPVKKYPRMRYNVRYVKEQFDFRLPGFPLRANEISL